jgi:hypothetical protein
MKTAIKKLTATVCAYLLVFLGVGTQNALALQSENLKSKIYSPAFTKRIDQKTLQELATKMKTHIFKSEADAKFLDAYIGKVKKSRVIQATRTEKGILVQSGTLKYTLQLIDPTNKIVKFNDTIIDRRQYKSAKEYFEAVNRAILGKKAKAKTTSKKVSLLEFIIPSAQAGLVDSGKEILSETLTTDNLIVSGVVAVASVLLLSTIGFFSGGLALPMIGVFLGTAIYRGVDKWRMRNAVESCRNAKGKKMKMGFDQYMHHLGNSKYGCNMERAQKSISALHGFDQIVEEDYHGRSMSGRAYQRAKRGIKRYVSSTEGTYEDTGSICDENHEPRESLKTFMKSACKSSGLTRARNICKKLKHLRACIQTKVKEPNWWRPWISKRSDSENYRSERVQNNVKKTKRYQNTKWQNTVFGDTLGGYNN